MMMTKMTRRPGYLMSSSETNRTPLEKHMERGSQNHHDLGG